MIIRGCVQDDETYDILKAYHDGPYGGHLVDKQATYKVLHQGYYWPTLLRMP